MEKQTIEVQATDGGLLVTESKQYTATESDIRQQITMLSNQQDGLINESVRLKKRYDEVTARKKELEKALEDNFKPGGMEVLG